MEGTWTSVCYRPNQWCIFCLLSGSAPGAYTTFDFAVVSLDENSHPYLGNLQRNVWYRLTQLNPSCFPPVKSGYKVTEAYIFHFSDETDIAKYAKGMKWGTFDVFMGAFSLGLAIPFLYMEKKDEKNQIPWKTGIYIKCADFFQ